MRYLLTGIFLVSFPSRFQESLSDTFVWRRQAAGHWLAREWHHWTSHEEHDVLTTCIYKYWHRQSVNNSDWLMIINNNNEQQVLHCCVLCCPKPSPWCVACISTSLQFCACVLRRPVCVEEVLYSRWNHVWKNQTKSCHAVVGQETHLLACVCDVKAVCVCPCVVL